MQPYPRAPDLVWPGHLHGTGCLSARAVGTGFPTVGLRLWLGPGCGWSWVLFTPARFGWGLGWVCLGSVFGVVPLLPAVCGVRGWALVSACFRDLCGFVRFSLAPRPFRFRCAVWACVLGPGLGCAPPFLAGLSGCVFCAFFFFFFRLLGVPVPGLVVSSPVSFLPGWAAGFFFFFFLLVSVPLFSGGPPFLAWCCRFWLGGPPVPVWGSCLRCPLGGGFGPLLCCWRAVWWLWRVFARPSPPPLFFFFLGGGGGYLAVPPLPSLGWRLLCGWCVVWLVPRHSWRRFLCATPRHSWLGFAAGGGGRSPPLLAGVCRRRWCVVCGGGVLVGLWLVCGVIGPSPLLAEVPVCYSPPLLAGFRFRWWWAVPATPGWGPLAAVVCGVWCVLCGVLVGLWLVCGVVGPSPLPAEVPVCYSPTLLAGFRCRWWWAVPATPGWGPLPAVVCGVWCVVCGGGVLVGLWLVCGVVGPSPLLAEVPVCYSPPLLAGFRCRWWWAVPATPGWGPRAAVVCGVWCVAVVCWWGCGWCVVWLVPRHSWRRFLCATPRHSWLGFAAAGGGRFPPLLAGIRLLRRCVVCGGGVLVGLWLVCGVVGPSPLLAEVPVCYSPPLLAGFRCRWWWAVPATPGWGPLAASVCGVWCVVGVPRHSWRRFLCATPRHSWLGFAAARGGRSPPLLAGVRWRRWCACFAWPGRTGRPPGRVLVRLTFSFGRFVFLLCLAPSGLGLPLSLSLLLPFLVGWGLWCVGWLLPGTCSCAVVRCVLCALSGFVAPGGRRCLAPVRVPWLWPAACLSGVPRGPAWCAAPRPVRSLSVLRSAFPTPWCLSPPRELAPPALLGGCAGHAEAGREPGSLCLPLAPAEAGALGSLRVVPVRGPAKGLSLAGPSGVGLGLRALRWLACVDPVTDASGFPYRPSFDGGLGRCTGAVSCGRRHLPLRVGGRHARVPCVFACACSSWPGRAGRPPGRVLVRLTFSFGRFVFLLCLAPSGLGLPLSLSLLLPFLVGCFSRPPAAWLAPLLCPPLGRWLLFGGCSPAPPPFVSGVFVAPACGLGVFFFFFFFFFLLPPCAPVVSGFLWFPAPGALGLGACVVCFVGLPLLGSLCACPSFVLSPLLLAAPAWLLPPPPPHLCPAVFVPAARCCVPCCAVRPPVLRRAAARCVAGVVLFVWCVLLLALGAVVRSCVLCCFLWCAVVRRCPCLAAWSASLWLVWFAVVPCFPVSCSVVLCCRVVLCCCALLSCCGAVGACFALLWAVVLCCVVLLVGCAVFGPVVVSACCGALFLALCVPCLLRSVRCGALLCWLWCPASLCRVLWRCAVVWCFAVVLCCRFAVLFVFALPSCGLSCGACVVCAVVGASCCGVSLCVVVSPWAFCGVVVLLWCVVVSCCAVRCPVVSCALCRVLRCRAVLRCCAGWLCCAVVCAAGVCFVLFSFAKNTCRFSVPLKTLFFFFSLENKIKLYTTQHTRVQQDHVRCYALRVTRRS